MGRPRLKIDPELVYKLARIHCTNQEIADVCECSVDTLERRFAAQITKGHAEGKRTLRAGLWDLAEKGNLGAMIWLSKQHLGMTEKVENKQDIRTEGPLIVYETNLSKISSNTAEDAEIVPAPPGPSADTPIN